MNITELLQPEVDREILEWIEGYLDNLYLDEYIEYAYLYNMQNS